MNKPITPEEMKAWIDATWEKCQSEAWKEPRQWVGLTDEERNVINRHNVYVSDIIGATEAKLKEKNT